jgi:hypothetical protein
MAEIDRHVFLWTCPTCGREYGQAHIQHIDGWHRAWWYCLDFGHAEIETDIVFLTLPGGPR